MRIVDIDSLDLNDFSKNDLSKCSKEINYKFEKGLKITCILGVDKERMIICDDSPNIHIFKNLALETSINYKDKGVLKCTPTEIMKYSESIFLVAANLEDRHQLFQIDFSSGKPVTDFINGKGKMCNLTPGKG